VRDPFTMLRGAAHEPWWRTLPFTFAVSTLAPSQSGVTPPMQNAFTFPLGLAEPRKHKTTSVGHQFFWCAGRKAGVGALRDH
jgi:hypothetical protein